MPINEMTREQFKELSQVMFPSVAETPSDIEAKYPPRDIPASHWVCRFAPSPTGFTHIGSVFAALLNRMVTIRGGVYILRIEDTDQNRKIERGTEKIIEALARMSLLPDEGPYTTDPISERGSYGPYIQSNRFHIYQVYAKYAVSLGVAYPCFMGSEELEAIRKEQTAKKIPPGIYGSWAHGRQLSFEDLRRRIAAGEKYVIRLKAEAREDEKVSIDDLIRDRLEFPANSIDAVLLKSDKFPTYHFAHVVDEQLMRVNLVLRADEWISSIPLHVQLHRTIGAPLPKYGHFAPIAIMEGSSRRKLSKRKDPEADVAYYSEKGYPSQSVIDYLLNLANSNFEDWRIEHQKASFTDFPFEIERIGNTSMLLDMQKLDNISKNVIAGYTAEQVYALLVEWAKTYRPALIPILTDDPEYSRKVLDVERTGDVPRKDMAKWEDFEEYYGFFFDPLFERAVGNGYQGMPALKPDDIVEVLNYLITTLPVFSAEGKDSWLARLRQYAADNNYAARRKDVERNPGQYKGWFGDIMMVFRVALTGKTFSPDMAIMIEVMGSDRVESRLARARDYFSSRESSV